ncbi:MAG: hypothetical protein EA394_02855 [Bacteroidia bacterium]|nr:MAG: hypothetical protein EA394_02855 [Bacteroidia bacterium]
MYSLVKNSVLILFISLIFSHSHSQIKDVGSPIIVNHPRYSYAASSQNWSITQSARGFIYFANNDGILEYDGSSWTTYQVPNTSVVRSVLAAGDTIYAGAFEEIGFLAPGDKGRLVWHSLNHLVPPEFTQFDEIWNIFQHDGRIIFQSFYVLLILENNAISVIEPVDNFGFMFNPDNDFFIVDRAHGLMSLQGNNLTLVSGDPLFLTSEINTILPHKRGELLIGTSNKGLYLWNGQNVYPWETPISEKMRKYDLFCGIKLSDGNIAFGSISNGVYISDPEGNILQHMNRLKGLQNNTVLALLEDNRGNLWTGLDNGIDFIEIRSPLTLFDYNYNIESTYATVVHNEILYVGTNQGLFAKHTDSIGSRKHNQQDFQLVEGTEGQVWSLQVIDNTLLCGHNFGCFQVDGFNARKISDIRGFWSFLSPPDKENLIIAGTYTGLVRLEKRGSDWHFLDEVKGFRESSRHLFLDNRNDLWISHGYRGLFRLSLTDDYSQVENVLLYFGDAGLPLDLPYNIHHINDRMIITTHDGIKYFDYDQSIFLSDPLFESLFEGKNFISIIHQDARGNLWYFKDDLMGVMRKLEDGSYRDITSPFSRINDMMIHAFQTIFVDLPHHVFIGTQMGLIHYDPNIAYDYHGVEEVFFTEISFYGKSQPVTYHAFSAEISENVQHIPKLPHALNSVIFRFTSPMFENPMAIRYSYILEGFDLTWSEWSELNFKEYTNLREGEYTFKVKARNPFGIETPVSSFQFRVDPPFLRSGIAYVLYAVIVLFIILGNVYMFRRRMLKIRLREKIRHEKKLARREQIFREQTALSEKEIVHLRNESLASEMQHKNKELANATMHLIQKNRTLTALKNDLGKMLKNIPDDNPEKHNIFGLLKKIHKELRNEKHWELFDNYFDEVHQDFITRLKSAYGDLSPKELRLCAYLRMNLSTKEIAPLMNISVRGVEISRYRLRKKLKLEPHENLTDYLISF